jgi:EmrB/QacA subfamily drug resistance transporter
MSTSLSRDTSGPALAIVTTCQLMLVVDATIVNIALPSIQRSLHLSPGSLSWVVTAYTLAFGGLLLLGGRAGDILGHRRVFLAGVALFTMASLVGGLATSGDELLAARAAQGVGAALAAPGTLALITILFAEGERRSRALAIFSMAASAGMVVGLLLGGVLTAWASWRAVFFVNVPFGLAVTVFTRRYIPESPRRRGRFDVVGALTATAGTTLLVYGFVRSAEHGWHSGLAAFVAAVALLAVFVAVEARAEQPIVPLRLFADRDRSAAYLMRLILTAAMSGMLYFLTLFVQNVLGYSALRTGLAFLPTTLATVAASRAVPKLLPRFGPRPIVTTGAALSTAGMVWLSQASSSSGYLSMILGPVLLFGAGAGLVAVAVTFVALSRMPSDDSGAGSGLLQAMQQVGGSLGVAVLTTVYASEHGFNGAFTAGAIFTGCMLLLSLVAFRRTGGVAKLDTKL